jgi:hypothetical protein
VSETKPPLPISIAGGLAQRPHSSQAARPVAARLARAKATYSGKRGAARNRPSPAADFCNKICQKRKSPRWLTAGATFARHFGLVRLSKVEHDVSWEKA